MMLLACMTSYVVTHLKHLGQWSSLHMQYTYSTLVLHSQNTLMITELFLETVKSLVPIVVTTVHV